MSERITPADKLRSPFKVVFLIWIVSFVLVTSALGQSIAGAISGTVRDPSDAVVPGASVKATNLQTDVNWNVVTNGSGVFSFPVLPIGSYSVTVHSIGFRPYERSGIHVDVSSSIRVDVVLQIGSSQESVEVNDEALHAETINTQLGDVIKGESVQTMPLNGRSYTDLLALQPGVAPQTTVTSLTVQGLGQSVYPPSGDLNAGALSINGQREAANGYFVNGADAEETGSLAAAIIPNLDSIAEFRILTSNFDAENGKYTGGQINVITKSGTNEFHGGIFEFMRNTTLDARNYFSLDRGEYIQNQFGGTFGGPIIHSKMFTFTDYQGTRQRQGEETGLIPVPSVADRSGNLMDSTSSLTGTVGGASFASRLSQQLGYTVAAGEPYYFAGCTSSSQCVLPNATIAKNAWSAPASDLLQYIPLPNIGSNEFSTSSSDQILRDDKFGERLDANTRGGSLSAYYFFDGYDLNNPYPTTQGGANVPGFNGLYTGRAQLIDLIDSKTLGGTAVNDLHLNYTRDVNDLGKAAGGLGVSLASQGFATGAGTLGIVPGAAQGVENIVFNNGSLVIGAVPGTFDQINNDFGINENFTKLLGRHSLKFGALLEYDQIDTHPYAFLNGSFNIDGSETGSYFADFLLGIATQYTQNQLRPFYGRNRYAGIYTEDSWRAKPNLTINYGLRWDRIEPWYEKYNNSITFIPGQQSVVFPTAPVGIVYPGDPGVSRTLAPPGDLDLAPRLGIAYSPSMAADSFLGKFFGMEGMTSIRVGFGIYYAAIAGETLGLISDNPPYGYTFQNASNPLLVTPFIDGDTGNVEGQRFPAQLAPLNASPSNPDPNIDFSQFEPIGATPGYKTTNRVPSAEQYMLSFERQYGNNFLVDLMYVGDEGHRLSVLEAANPGEPALCLSLPGCGPDGENNVYVTTSGEMVNGTRGPLGPNFGSVSYQTTIGNSSYNALEASLRYANSHAEIFLSYTYSKSIDWGSNLGDQVDPYNPSLLRGLSSFDMRHNFVASYRYDLPFGELFRASNRSTEGWRISGITHFSTGFPITLINPLDTSLIGTFGNGINNLTVDELDRTSVPLSIVRDPRNVGNRVFDPAAFSLPADDPTVGNTIANTIGNSGRRFFSGPGIENYDFSVEKDTPIVRSLSFNMRVEAFNIFNHGQFYGPLSVDGNYGDIGSTFGQAVSAAAPRLMQVAAKFVF